MYEGRERENIQDIKLIKFLFLYPPLSTADAVTCYHADASVLVTCDHADASALVTCYHADASALLTCDHADASALLTCDHADASTLPPPPF